MQWNELLITMFSKNNKKCPKRTPLWAYNALEWKKEVLGLCPKVFGTFLNKFLSKFRQSLPLTCVTFAQNQQANLLVLWWKTQKTLKNFKYWVSPKKSEYEMLEIWVDLQQYKPRRTSSKLLNLQNKLVWWDMKLKNNPMSEMKAS